MHGPSRETSFEKLDLFFSELIGLSLSLVMLLGLTVELLVVAVVFPVDLGASHGQESRADSRDWGFLQQLIHIASKLFVEPRQPQNIVSPMTSSAVAVVLVKGVYRAHGTQDAPAVARLVQQMRVARLKAVHAEKLHAGRQQAVLQTYQGFAQRQVFGHFCLRLSVTGFEMWPEHAFKNAGSYSLRH